MTQSILPGATIGIVGGGQLGRMSILAGRRMGFRFVVLDPDPACPAAAVADQLIVAPYGDEAALGRLAAACDAITLEFENIPAAALAPVAEQVPVRPSADVLHICQNRRREKLFLRQHGFACAPFAVVDSLCSLRTAVRTIGLPAVLKTADFGYDGKGQQRLDARTDLGAAWQPFDGKTAVLEQWIAFRGEYSVICARNPQGAVAVYPVAANVHTRHILDTTVVPAGLSPADEAAAQSLAVSIAEALRLEGLLAVELFLTDSGWLVNELAPRPHNSGHHTLDACVTSQFEQHIRAVANLPLGDTRMLSPVCMVNLLGDLWPAHQPQPDWAAVLAEPAAKLHLYGKSQARPGRKMGHINVLANSPQQAHATATGLWRQLASPTDAPAD
jgi:5-(carboxyamino)imidazole ribonucleotide synthase